MARCTICEHPKRAAIEAELDGALADVDALAALAEKFSLTTGQIRRHPGHPPGPSVAPAKAVRPKADVTATASVAPRPRAPALAAVAPPEDEDDEAAPDKRALQHAREHVLDLREALRNAAVDDKLELQKALTQAIGMQGRLERADAERIARILKSPEWRRVESTVLAALKPFGPKVLRAVGDALAKLEAEDTDTEARAA